MNSISFTELHDTAGYGHEVRRSRIQGSVQQCKGREVHAEQGRGGSTEDDVIDSVSGASMTSGAVVNAVNAALDFVSDRIG